MLIFSESSKRVAKYFHLVISGIRIFFFFKWVNKIFWVAAISVGRSKRENKQDFKLSHIHDKCSNLFCLFIFFPVLIPAQEFLAYIDTSPLPVKGCKI
jgi:hypothetical protein